MIRFRVEKAPDAPLGRKLVYRANEYSFDMEPPPTEVLTTILVNNLNLALDASFRVVGVYGLSVYTKWISKDLQPPPASMASAVAEGEFEKGVSVRLFGPTELATYVDQTNRWVFVSGKATTTRAHLILPGTILELGAQGEFTGLWLRPETG